MELPTTITDLAHSATSNPGTSVAVISAMAAVTAALIAYRQSTTARAKLKLDLYDKRFSIYVSSLELYHAMMTKELKEIEELGIYLIECSGNPYFYSDAKMVCTTH